MLKRSLVICVISVIAFSCQKGSIERIGSSEEEPFVQLKSAESDPTGNIGFGGAPDEGIEPELILEKSNEGYQFFIETVGEHVDQETSTIDWGQVSSAIASEPSLSDVHNWLNANASNATGHVLCTNACWVKIPYSCESCIGGTYYEPYPWHW